MLNTEPSGDPTREVTRGAPGLPAAVLWDMDGTLVDTEPSWIDVERALVEEHGGTWTSADGLALVGKNLLDAGTYLREVGGVDLAPEEIVEVLLDGVVEQVMGKVPWRPGARELLAALRADGLPCALVTMSYERFATPVLQRLPRGSFDVVVTGDTVSPGKPHPEPYLHAARLLGVDPARCVAIEDSETGARSAEAAGCLVLVVENHVPVAPGVRRVFRKTLEGLAVAELRRLALEGPRS